MYKLLLPIDKVTGTRKDFDCAADYLELTAFFADNLTVLITDLANYLEIGAEDIEPNLDNEMQSDQEQLIEGTVDCINNRHKVLSPSAYPFNLDKNCEVLTCNFDKSSFGHMTYILSLVLSNLKEILYKSCLHPDERDIRQLRQFFQYCATAALASEIYGRAWSFGFPRLDRSGFLDKLKEIWEVVRDGSVAEEPQRGAPKKAKDDKIDIFAARLHPDRLPGFPLAVAQVATGKNIRDKSLKGHIEVFKKRWFVEQPVTQFLIYMVIPFAIESDQFIDDVASMGNVLHRLRVPRRVMEAQELVDAHKISVSEIEGYDKLSTAMQWILDYQNQSRRLG